ncbi:MAG: sigma 54-interacting transcriptional regulator [Nitrosomonas sp.]|nr:sigma 54-interacting transcriptional regulator [Nitrosomonas sp.]
MIGQSQVFLETLQLIEKIAHCEAPVLIEGETSTGKELTGKETWAIEVKRTLAPQFTKGHRLASQDIQLQETSSFILASNAFIWRKTLRQSV